MIRRLALPVLLATAGVASPDGGGGNVPTPGEAATQACPAPVMAPPVVFAPEAVARHQGGPIGVPITLDTRPR